MTDVEKLYNILMTDNISSSLNENLGDLLMLIPELRDTIGFEHKHPHHHLDVWDHTVCALMCSTLDFDVRLSLLLHDIGKPHSYQEDGEIRHFKGHPKVSKKMAKEILKRLGFNDLYNKKICYLIANHDEPITNRDIKRYPELSEKRLEIQRCDALAHHPDKLEKRVAYINLISNKILTKKNSTK